MGAYTIGFLGHFAYTERICDYMDTLILRTLQQHGEVRVMVTLRREADRLMACLLYTSPSPRDRSLSRMPSSA